MGVIGAPDPPAPAPDREAVAATARAARAELRRWYRASGSAHVTLLRWYRCVGYARFDGVGVEMDEPPAIAGSDIEYLGGHTGRIDGRPMTREEVMHVRRLLAQMANDAHDALGGHSTLAVRVEMPRE